MFQLKNTSPFAPAISVFPNSDGIDTLYVVLRGAFSIAPKVDIAPVQLAPVLADEYRGDPARSSLRYASELNIGKPSTDVVLNGCAWPTSGRSESELVTMTVAERRKTVRVFGDRVWRDVDKPSNPEPFESLPLIYERAFGGVAPDPNDPTRSTSEERNPVGLGFRGKRSDRSMIGQKLPNLEDPSQPLKQPGDTPPPGCFGFVAPSWMPRRQWGGTYDDAWRKRRAPYLPQDFRPEFFNAASPEMIFPRFLEGGEPVSLVGASREGPMRFVLPRCALHVGVEIASRSESPPLHLETVCIEPDENRLLLTWRGAVRCGSDALKIREITVGLARMDLSDGPVR